MEQCPLAYIDPCPECAQFGKCCPSQSLQKLVAVENQLQELKELLQNLVDKK